MAGMACGRVRTALRRRDRVSVQAERVLFVDDTAALGDAQLSLLDIAVAHRERGAVALFEDGPFAAALVAHNVALIPVEMKKRRRALATFAPSARAIYALSRVARSFGVLYANSPPSFLISSAAGLLARRPVVWHLREILDQQHFPQLYRRVLITTANRRASRVVANSRVVADAFISAGGRRQLVHVIHDGVDTTPFDQIEPPVRGDVRRALGVDEHVYLVGSLDDQTVAKQRLLLDALEMVPGALAVVISGTAGASDNEARLIAACDVVVVSASSTADVSPRTIVKALLGRRPLVVSDVRRVREMVEDGVTGILVPPGDSAAIAAAIREVRADPVRGDEIAFAGSLDARRRFSRVAMNASVTRLVDEVLHGKSGLGAL
jgi:glycosyltransferase involved in cell wall biosynthesis